MDESGELCRCGESEEGGDEVNSKTKTWDDGRREYIKNMLMMRLA